MGETFNGGQLAFNLGEEGECPPPAMKPGGNTRLPMLCAGKAPDEKLKINKLRPCVHQFTYSYCSSNDRTLHHVCMNHLQLAEGNRPC